MRYKNILMRLTLAFIGLLLFFTFFSRTLVDLNVPRVSLTFSQQGHIRPEAVSSGIVRPADTERILAPVTGRITYILEEGDTINAQTVLFTITNDLQALQDTLTQLEHDRRMAALNIERAQNEQSAEQQRLNQMLTQPAEAPATPTLRLWEYDMQLEANTNDEQRILDELADLEILYEEGIIPRQSIVDKEGELTRLAQAREQIVQRRYQAIQNHEEAMILYEELSANLGRNRDVQIQSQRDRIAQLGFTIRIHNLEMERVMARIDEVSQQIEDDGVTYVTLEEGAFANRAVAEILPGMAIGATVQEGAAVMVTTLRNNQFIIEAPFPQIQDFISTGQEARIRIGKDEINGSTGRITPDGGRNIVTIEVQGGGLVGGELAMVTILGASTNHPAVVPLSALRREQNNYFILYVEAYEGWFGSNYYVRSQMVNPLRRDTANVAINGLHGMVVTDAPIIINSDMPISAGDRVRLVAGYAMEPAR